MDKKRAGEALAARTPVTIITLVNNPTPLCSYVDMIDVKRSALNSALHVNIAVFLNTISETRSLHKSPISSNEPSVKIFGMSSSISLINRIFLLQ